MGSLDVGTHTWKTGCKSRLVKAFVFKIVALLKIEVLVLRWRGGK